MSVNSGQQRGEIAGVVGRIVFAGDERPFEKDPAACARS